MEARARFGRGGQAPLFSYGLGSGDLEASMGGKRSTNSLEWDLNDWKWDEDLFLATPLINSSANPLINCHHQSRQIFPLKETEGVAHHHHHAAAGAYSNSSSSCSDELNLGGAGGSIDLDVHTRELDKHRRVIVVQDDNLEDEAAVSLVLKLGGERGYSTPRRERDAANWEDGNASGRKTKVAAGTAPSRAVCQVEDCRADLTKAKDYHRRHKVCEMYSKASKALVGNFIQRFCQQCSRFHVLQEFDEGKRSCLRRLAGHNKRRRKKQPDHVENENSSNDSQACGYLLMSILKILSNIQ